MARWYIGRYDFGYQHIENVVGVIVAPDDVGKEEIEDLLRRGGEEILRPYWDYRRRFRFRLLKWEEMKEPYRWSLQKDIVEGAETGHFWNGSFREKFMVVYWDDLVKAVAEPAAFRELDALAQRRGSFRNAKRISELLRLLNESE